MTYINSACILPTYMKLVRQSLWLEEQTLAALKNLGEQLERVGAPRGLGRSQSSGGVCQAEDKRMTCTLLTLAELTALEGWRELGRHHKHSAFVPALQPQEACQDKRFLDQLIIP
jgi:hypothetical protein